MTKDDFNKVEKLIGELEYAYKYCLITDKEDNEKILAEAKEWLEELKLNLGDDGFQMGNG